MTVAGIGFMFYKRRSLRRVVARPAVAVGNLMSPHCGLVQFANLALHLWHDDQAPAYGPERTTVDLAILTLAVDT